MTNLEAIQILKSECYIADLLNLDRTRLVNTALDLAITSLKSQSDWLDSFNTDSATECFTAIQKLKEVHK